MKRIVWLGLALLLGCESCLKRHAVEHVEVLPYPECETPAEVLSEGVLAAGPLSREAVTEFYRVTRCGDLHTITVRQEWRLAFAEVDAVFDADWRPLRAWKRKSVPGEEDLDIRRYEFRTEQVTMTEDTPDGRAHRIIDGQRPIALVGPGRAILNAYIQSSDLDVGETTRGPVLDFRKPYEEIDEVALRRDPDHTTEELGTVHVYTVFGRESVFVDPDTGWIVGDLAGLRDAARLPGPIPTPHENEHGAPDPRGTP